MVATTDYLGFMVFFFESGKVAKVDMKSYLTKTNRKKLIKAYFEGDKLVFCDYSKEEKNYILTSSCGKILIFSSEKLSLKQTKNTQGIMIMKQKIKLVMRLLREHSILMEKLYLFLDLQ